MTHVFMGLDIETSGTTPAHQLIQIGLANGALDVLALDVGWNPNELVVDPESLQVNGFTPERIYAAPAWPEVDAACRVWLDRRLPADRAQVVPIGWNIAAFDMPYVRSTLPRTAERIQRRSVDLNAICFALDGREGHNWEWWKKHVKRETEAILGVPRWHDAGFDAAAGLVSFGVLRQLVGGRTKGLDSSRVGE